MTSFGWIMDSQLFRHVPMAPAAPDKYSLSLFMSQPTPLISVRAKVASLYAALLSHEHRWPCGLPGGLVPCGQPLRRFWFVTGEVFRLLMKTGIEPAPIASNAIALPIELFSGWREMCFSTKLRKLLAYRILHTSICFRLRATCNLQAFTNPPVRY